MAQTELTALLSKHDGATGLPAHYLAWVFPALGPGLAFQAYLKPGALPPGLYTATVKQLLGRASPVAED